MPDRLIHDTGVREVLAIMAALVAGYVAKTLTSKDKFNLKHFAGEMIISVMMGWAIYAFGIINELGFWETLLIALWSGMGATRTFEWATKILNNVPSNKQ